MRKIFPIMFILLQACTSRPADVNKTPSVDPLPLQTVVASTFEALTAQAVLTSTSTLPAAPATQTSQPISAGGISPIQFDANGTYKDLIDSIQAGSSKTYSIRAMKGQVTSVSFWPQTADGTIPISMRIKGADGQTLCSPENRACKFWRGVLPASQDYFVTLASESHDLINFTLRVAINPPGVDTQNFQYVNPSTGLSLTYPDTFAPTNGPFDGYITTWGNNKIEPGLLLHLIDTAMFTNTNLSAVYLTAGSTSDAQVVAGCMNSNPNGPSEQAVGNQIVNGYTFLHAMAAGAAAGHVGEQNIYRMVHDNICYEVIFHIHEFSIANLAPGSTIVEFDKNAVMQELNGVFSTFKIN